MRHLLILQLAIVNLLGFAGLVAGWSYVQTVLTSDTSRISYAILAIWIFGLVACAIRAVKVSRLLDSSKVKPRPFDYVAIRIKSRKGGAKLQHVRKLSEWCAALGMFGTVVGLIILARSIGEVTAENISATIAHAFAGFSIALGTTAVGAICALWLELNLLFVDTATQCLATDMDR